MLLSKVRTLFAQLWLVECTVHAYVLIAHAHALTICTLDNNPACVWRQLSSASRGEYLRKVYSNHASSVANIVHELCHVVVA